MNIADELVKLKQLHDSGALNKEEFAKAKQAVLNQRAGADSEAPETIQDHLMRKAEKPKAPASAPKKGPAYAAVAPKVATLDPGECHLYTFTISPHVYREATFFPPRFAGWYTDFTRFIVHLTDRRILVEPYEFTSTENALVKGAMFLGNLNLSGKIVNASLQDELDAGKKTLHQMSGHCLALAYSDIAKVDRQPKPSYSLVNLARVHFVKPDTQPLVATVCAGVAGAVSLYWHVDDFVRIMNEMLEPATRTKLAAS
jgi:hypothetical protein